MARYKDGLRVATCVFEAAAWRHVVEIRCQCGHFARHDPHGLWLLCEERGWSDYFWELKPRFYCTRCYAGMRRKVRPKTIEAIDGDTPVTICLPRPAEEYWKKVIRRYRG